MYETVRFIAGGRFISRDAWQHPERRIDSHELILVLQGRVALFIGDRFYCATPGQMLHLPPDVPHGGTERTEEPVSFYWIHFSGNSSTDPLPGEFAAERTSNRVEILCKQLLHCANSPEYPPDCSNYYMRLLLFELHIQRPASSPLSARVEEWIRTNCDRPIHVTDIASHFELNPDYLSRVFKKDHPEGLKEYLDSMRCQRIKKTLVSTDLPLQSIAQQYGFSDYKYFLKYFRFHEGITPTQYRKAYFNLHTNCK
jgi:AraC-like DNA-binding protein